MNNLFSPDGWFAQLSPRDQILASINTAEFFSDRTRDLRTQYMEYVLQIPPCTHCGAPDHGIADCPRRAEYTGLSKEQLEQNFRDGKRPFLMRLDDDIATCETNPKSQKQPSHDTTRTPEDQ